MALIGMGLTAGAVVTLLLLLERRPRTGRGSGPGEAGSGPPEREAPPMERRQHVRRAGVPTAVRVSDAAEALQEHRAFVIDRSIGGVQVAVQERFPPGRRLRVRPEEAPEEVPWVPLVVRHGRRVGDYYEIGCQFEEEQPWHVLVVFG
ncbi:MAG TPA: PilZ domain-containing protein [Gemmataceae bacterium]